MKRDGRPTPEAEQDAFYDRLERESAEHRTRLAAITPEHRRHLIPPAYKRPESDTTQEAGSNGWAALDGRVKLWIVAAAVVVVIFALGAGCGGSNTTPAASVPVAAPIAAPVTATAPRVMPNLVGLTFDQSLQAIIPVYPSSHLGTDDDGSDSTATVVSQEPAAGTALEPEDGSVTLHMSDAAKNPTPTAATDTGSDSDSSSSSSSDHQYIPHPHVHSHVCVGGKHVHVCS